MFVSAGICGHMKWFVCLPILLMPFFSKSILARVFFDSLTLEKTSVSLALTTIIQDDYFLTYKSVLSCVTFLQFCPQKRPIALHAAHYELRTKSFDNIHIKHSRCIIMISNYVNDKIIYRR
jgi:hypothetical protein